MGRNFAFDILNFGDVRSQSALRRSSRPSSPIPTAQMSRGLRRRLMSWFTPLENALSQRSLTLVNRAGFIKTSTRIMLSNEANKLYGITKEEIKIVEGKKETVQ